MFPLEGPVSDYSRRLPKTEGGSVDGAVWFGYTPSELVVSNLVEEQSYEAYLPA